MLLTQTPFVSTGFLTLNFMVFLKLKTNQNVSFFQRSGRWPAVFWHVIRRLRLYNPLQTIWGQGIEPVLNPFFHCSKLVQGSVNSTFRKCVVRYFFLLGLLGLMLFIQRSPVHPDAGHFLRKIPSLFPLKKFLVFHASAWHWPGARSSGSSPDSAFRSILCVFQRFFLFDTQFLWTPSRKISQAIRSVSFCDVLECKSVLIILWNFQYIFCSQLCIFFGQRILALKHDWSRIQTKQHDWVNSSWLLMPRYTWPRSWCKCGYDPPCPAPATGRWCSAAYRAETSF